MVMEVVHEDVGDGNPHCTNHPFKPAAAPGGICALCLQEKLGKLVSSSSPMSVFPSTSSSPSPSFRSDFDTARRPPLVSSAAKNGEFVFKRSKSTAGPPRRRRIKGMNFSDESFGGSPHRKGFWSFLYASKGANKKSGEKGFVKDSSFSSSSSTAVVAVGGGPSSAVSGVAGPSNLDREDENHRSPPGVLDRRVSRSRSVGCGGSRSFSGDFFGRISTGFGDCTLRRVESQREGKSKAQSSPSVRRQEEDCMIKERVRCGGIFRGFVITTSSSSSSSSSLVHEDSSSNTNSLCHGRSGNKRWGWALASPMRAFSNKQYGRREAPPKHATPNLSAIPSLLAVSS